MPTSLPSFAGFGEQLFSQTILIGKVLFYGAIFAGILFAFVWVFSYKHRIIILGKTIKFDKGKKVITKNGIAEFKFLKKMAFKKGNPAVPMPDESLAYSSEGGKDTYFYAQRGDFAYHTVTVPNDFTDESIERFREEINEDLKHGEFKIKKINPVLGRLLRIKRELIYTPLKFPKALDMGKVSVVASDFYNWHINRLPRNMARFQKQEKWKEWLLPMLFGVFMVMICITLWMLFKQLPRSISIDVVQGAVPGF